MGEMKTIMFRFNISLITSFWRSPPPLSRNVNTNRIKKITVTIVMIIMVM